jgi:hypothetical protein
MDEEFETNSERSQSDLASVVVSQLSRRLRQEVYLSPEVQEQPGEHTQTLSQTNKQKITERMTQRGLVK